MLVASADGGKKYKCLNVGDFVMMRVLGLSGCLEDSWEGPYQVKECISNVNDLSKGFYQVGMDEKSKQYTAFVCPLGHFQFRRMPFGLKNAPNMFQDLVSKVLAGCSEYSANCIDDNILVFLDTWSDHLGHLENVLSVLGKAGLTIKSEKCLFGVKHVEYLGHLVGDGKLLVPSHRVAAMANYPRPKTKKQLRSFLLQKIYQ